MAAERQHRYLPGAQEDLITAVTRYEREHAGLGDEFLKAVDRAIAIVLAAPERSPLAPRVSHLLGVRRYVLKRFPYGLIYRLIAGTSDVEIVPVAHHRRRPG